jgi:Sulfotransferase family
MSPRCSCRWRIFVVWCTVLAVSVGVTLPRLLRIPSSYKYTFEPLIRVVGNNTLSAALTGAVKDIETKLNLPSSVFRRDNDWRGFQENRSIAFVHVGKAGGMTIRTVTSLVCGVKSQNTSCVNKRFPKNATLSRQVKYYLHVFGYRPDQLKHATSFLVALRNPVDRIISAYRFSHPANCRDDSQTQRNAWGCRVKKQAETPGLPAWKVYTLCFPSASMEDFAQSVLSPYPSQFSASHLSNKAIQLRGAAVPGMCPALAHQMVRGFGSKNPDPHMKYNYHYYVNRTVSRHPEKEVFGVRTEHEWEDLTSLDKAIGGTGIFLQQGRHESHGSEAYLPSPLTTEAYYKLCCVLEQEIAIYQDLILRVQNFNETVKQEAIGSVREKCGMGSKAFEEWRAECLARIEQDRSIWGKNWLTEDKQLGSTTSDSTPMRPNLRRKKNRLNAATSDATPMGPTQRNRSTIPREGPIHRKVIRPLP